MTNKMLLKTLILSFIAKKTMWDKEKILVTSNSSFSHCVFKRLVSQGRQKVLLCGNGLNCIIGKNTADCQQTFGWWQPVVSRHFQKINRWICFKRLIYKFGILIWIYNKNNWKHVALKGWTNMLNKHENWSLTTESNCRSQFKCGAKYWINI